MGTSSNISEGEIPLSETVFARSEAVSAVFFCIIFSSSNSATSPFAAFWAFCNAFACFSAAFAALFVDVLVLSRDLA